MTFIKKNIFAIIGSASKNSANEKLIDHIGNLTKKHLHITVFKDLKTLPHFDPELSINNPPDSIISFRNSIEQADGIIISTPEYVFSIPGGLKNAIEWCVATNVFSGKPTGIITASANGQKGHEELQLIMKTVMSDFTADTTLLIQGIKGKINEEGKIIDGNTTQAIQRFIDAFLRLITNKYPKNFPVITTHRLHLRQLKTSDSHEILALRSNETVNKYLDRKPSHSVEDAINFIHTINENIQNNDSIYWGICLINSEVLIGTICLFNFSNDRSIAEIGFELLPDFHGKGIMKEAASAVINYGFQKIGLNSIEAYTHPENESSQKLLDCLGFTQKINPGENCMKYQLSINRE